jgi:hypothetical protein
MASGRGAGGADGHRSPAMFRPNGADDKSKPAAKPRRGGAFAGLWLLAVEVPRSRGPRTYR